MSREIKSKRPVDRLKRPMVLTEYWPPSRAAICCCSLLFGTPAGHQAKQRLLPLTKESKLEKLKSLRLAASRALYAPGVQSRTAMPHLNSPMIAIMHIRTHQICRRVETRWGIGLRDWTP